MDMDKKSLTMEASIGRNRVVVAVLLEHSVNMATSRDSSMEMAKGGMLCSGMRRSPSHKESPDFFVWENKHQRPNIQSDTVRKMTSGKHSGVTSLPWANA